MREGGGPLPVACERKKFKIDVYINTYVNSDNIRKMWHLKYLRPHLGIKILIAILRTAV